jgi:hypothetical protein
MAEEVSIDLLINTANAANSIGEIKAAMRDLKSAALEAGEGSAEFMKIGQAAGQLQDRINDVNDTVRVLAGNRMEQLTRSFSSVAQAGIGGFQAIAGAQAFFGSENEDLQKQMVKLQGLLNLSQGIAQFANIGQAAKDFKIVMASLIPSLFTATAAQEGLNVAMSLNPAGIVVAAIAALAAAYVLFSDDTDEAAEAQKKFNEQLKKVRATAEESGKLQDAQRKGEVELAKAKGATLKEVYELEKRNAIASIRQLEALNTIGAGLDKEQKLRLVELKNDLLIIEATYEKDVKDLRDEATAERKAERDKEVIETAKAIDSNLRQLEKNSEARLEIITEFNQTYEQVEEEFDRIRVEHKYWTDEQIYASIKKRLADEKKLKDDALAEDIERETERIEYEKYANEQYQLGREERSRVKEAYHLTDDQMDRKFAELRMKYMDTEKYSSEALYRKIAEDEQKKRDEFNKTTNTVMRSQIAATNTLINLNNLVTAIEMRNLKDGEELSLEVQKKQFKRKKALAVVEAVINTQLAMIGMLNDPGGIEGFVLAGVARLNGMLAVATILAQKFQPDGGYSGGASISTPAISTSFGGGSIQSTPSSQSPTNDAISPNFFGTAGAFYGNNAPVYAYVLENELTDAQLRAERLRNRARLR